MSTGYTPLFGSLSTGTLAGKWPDIGLWPVVLSITDRHGNVDVRPEYLAIITGLPVEEVEACMARFCEPDRYSRSAQENGARLRLIDPENRNWGWVVVNCEKYRERARLMSRDAKRTASGEDAERKRAQRSKQDSNDVPRCPPMSPSQTRLDKTRLDKTKQEEKKIQIDASSPSTAVSLVFEHWKQVFNKPKAKLDTKRERKIINALKSYSPEDLCRCINGYKKSPFHNGANKSGRPFDDINLILKDAQHIEEGISMDSNPPQAESRLIKSDQSVRLARPFPAKIKSNAGLIGNGGKPQ